MTCREHRGRHRLSLVAKAAVALIVATAMLPATVTHAATNAADNSEYIVVLRDTAVRDTVIARQHQRVGVNVDVRYGAALKGYAARLSTAQAAEIGRDADVLFVANSHHFRVGPRPPGPPFVNPPCDFPAIYTTCQIATRAIRRIDAHNSSTRSGDGHGAVPINVAVLDSGVQPSNELNVVGGVDCAADGLNTTDDVEGHGTFTAGVIGAIDNDHGVVGVAPGARIWSVRVLDANLEADDAQLLCAIDWITATRFDADPTNNIAVANLSLGGPGQDDGACGRRNHDAIHHAICAAVAAGITFVVSAGNDTAPLEGVVPAAYREVLSVTGIADGDGTWGGLTPEPCYGTADDAPAFFSNYATDVRQLTHVVAASAVCVTSLWPSANAPTPEFAVRSGTSFSAPAGAGVVALCIWSGGCRGLDPQQIVTKIVTDALANSARFRYYGFTGDPFHPIPGQYFGPLLRASLY